MSEQIQMIEFSPILIACSGGADSVFLLHYLYDLRKNKNLILHACYVDHKLRPESVSESKFVDKICHKLKIPFHFVSFDDNFWDGSKKNMEERARKKRYRLLHDLAVQLECEAIATGHHLDDQVETLLMRMFDRGTGLKGLAGIKPVSQIDLSPVKIIRPLLHMSRAEITERMKGKEHLSDQSNNNTDIRRNFYRKEVIPSIEKALKSDEFKKHVYNLSLNVQREIEFTKEITKEFWENNSLDPSFKKREEEAPSLSKREGGGRVAKRGAGGELFLIPRETIEKYSVNFWLTALSYLFSEYRNFSHCTDALIDIVKFIRKKEPAEANYDPFIFIRNKEGIKIQHS